MSVISSWDGFGLYNFGHAKCLTLERAQETKKYLKRARIAAEPFLTFGSKSEEPCARNCTRQVHQGLTLPGVAGTLPFVNVSSIDRRVWRAKTQSRRAVSRLKWHHPRAGRNAQQKNHLVWLKMDNAGCHSYARRLSTSVRPRCKLMILGLRGVRAPPARHQQPQHRKRVFQNVALTLQT